MLPAVKVQNLSKHYRLGLTHSGSIRELLNGAASQLLRRKPKPAAPQTDSSRVDDDGKFWALKDVDFEINAGEVIGIIGRNGAGKSTLLKMLSRITLPSAGRIEMRGRVASLLEVGTGFHPELTGRENVHMNGTILGMTRQEIDRQFDAIVDFAGVETFIDTPVKRYSSGMALRLGFAVAAHLKTDILIVDEVLAVGDVDFQAKCLDIMQAAAFAGRTVLFVSHQMSSVERLTRTCLLLENGRIRDMGATASIIPQYLKRPTGQNALTPFADWPQQSIGGDHARIKNFKILKTDGHETTEIPLGQDFTIEIVVHVQPARTVDVSVVIENASTTPLLSSNLSDSVGQQSVDGETTFRIRVHPNYFKPGRYLITTAIMTDVAHVQHAIAHFPAFEICPSQEYTGLPTDKRWGDMIVPYHWSTLRECNG